MLEEGLSPEQDAISKKLQQSHINHILKDAKKATLNEPSRPFTPGDLGRGIVSGNEYQDRPGSSYKTRTVVENAIEGINSRATTSDS